MDFAEIYGRYARDVHRFSLYLSGNFALAEDLTSQTFVQALCGRTNLRVDTVKAYLLAIARNLYRDYLQRQRRIVALDDLTERVDGAPFQDRLAESRQTLATVLSGIQRLPESQREALVLSFQDDLKYEQIAAILGCSIAAVKVRIHRARVQLKEDLRTKEESHENVTRDVIADLWPLYVSGDASSDTRSLVEAFLAGDPVLAEKLRKNGGEIPAASAPSLSPDHELKTLAEVKRRLDWPRLLFFLSMIFSMTAFGRLISDTSFDVSPRKFIAAAGVAALFWIAFFVKLVKGRREVLIRIRR